MRGSLKLIDGLALDFGKQGMRIQTGTIETGELQHHSRSTVAFKNKLTSKSICRLEQSGTPDLPRGTGPRRTGCSGLLGFTSETWQQQTARCTTNT